VKKLVVIFVLLASSILGADKTPYRLALPGNIYGSGTDHHAVGYMRWLSDRFDLVINGGISWLDSMRTTDTSLPQIWAGPYRSPQEVTLYESGDNTIPYAERLLDTATHWSYIYAKGYCDSASISPESLVCHWDNEMVAITQGGDGYRKVDNISTLNHSEKRATYQYWNNTVADTFCYPDGYVNYANGWNDDVKAAFADAYYKALVEDPEAVGYPAEQWDCFFADNQLGYGPGGTFYGTYISPDSFRGGTGDSLCWQENGGYCIMSAGLVWTTNWSDYFVNSTCAIDSAIMERMPDTIFGIANCEMSSASNVHNLLKYMGGVWFEHPIDYTKDWAKWNAWIAAMDSCVIHPETKSVLEYRGTLLLSGSGWLSDTGRVMGAVYAFWLITRDTNCFYAPFPVDMGDYGGNRRAWGNIYLVDFGEFDGAREEVSSDANSHWYKRWYNGGNSLIVFRTGFSSADYSGRNDSVKITFGKTMHEVSYYADTSEVGVDSTWVQPYEGKFFVTLEESASDTTFLDGIILDGVIIDGQ